MMWLAANWHSILLAVGGGLFIAGAVWWAGYADRLEQERRVAARAPISELEVEQHGRSTVERLEAYSNQEYAAAREFQRGARQLDEYALGHPMPQRPKPSAADLGEPWRLRRDGAEPGLVGPGETEINPLRGDDS